MFAMSTTPGFLWRVTPRVAFPSFPVIPRAPSIAWSEPSLEEPSYRYRGNTLFQLALKDNFLTRGYVREVPGAPMCGCVEKMPVVTDAACLDLDVSEEFLVTDQQELIHQVNSIKFKPCAEGILSARMAKLARSHQPSRAVSINQSRVEREMPPLPSFWQPKDWPEEIRGLHC